MATLTAGNSATFNISAFESIACNGGQGTLTFTSLAQDLMSSHTETLANKTFGPFGVPQTVTIAVTQGSCTYTTSADAASVTAAGAAWVASSVSRYGIPNGGVYLGAAFPKKTRAGTYGRKVARMNMSGLPAFGLGSSGFAACRVPPMLTRSQSASRLGRI